MKQIKTSLTVIQEIIGDAPFLFEGSFADGIAYAEKTGYDYVEIHSTTPDELDDPSLARALEKHNVKVGALGTGRLYVNAGLSLTDTDPAIRSKAIEQMKRYVDAAQRLNSLVIIGCVRGNVPSPDQRETVTELLGQAMQELDAYALDRNVIMVFEPINRYENNYLCNTYEIADFLRKYELQNIRMMIDTFHMNIEEVDIRQSIIDNIDYISYVHFADSNRLWPGQGHLDFDMIVDTLLECGYRGIISAECLPLPTKETAAVEWLSSVKGMLERYE